MPVTNIMPCFSMGYSFDSFCAMKAILDGFENTVFVSVFIFCMPIVDVCAIVHCACVDWGLKICDGPQSRTGNDKVPFFLSNPLDMEPPLILSLDPAASSRTSLSTTNNTAHTSNPPATPLSPPAHCSLMYLLCWGDWTNVHGRLKTQHFKIWTLQSPSLLNPEYPYISTYYWQHLGKTFFYCYSIILFRDLDRQLSINRNLSIVSLMFFW